MRSIYALSAFLSTIAVAMPARSESLEHVVSLEGLMILPRLESRDDTAFIATSFGGRVSYAFGVTDDLYTLVRFSSWIYDGAVDGVTESSPQGQYTGRLFFHGEGYRPEIGARWKALSGFNVAPYLEAYVGYQWTTFRDRDLRNRLGGSYGLNLNDFGRGSLTVAGGISGDIRLGNMVFLGLSGLWTKAFADDFYRGDLTFSARLGYYWF